MDKNKYKIFIYGSCVSRDPFELDNEGKFEIVDYFARSSLASLVGKPYIDKKIIDGISKPWAKKVTKQDMEKSLFEHLLKQEFDVLIVDLIDERHNLHIKENIINTISVEYGKALYHPNQYSTIKAFSDEKFNIWIKGLEKLAYCLKKNNLDNKVVLNKIYWTNFIGEEKSINIQYSTEHVEKANNELERMYIKFIKFLPNTKVVKYPKEMLYSDPNHKWGLAPFHYNDFVMRHQLLELERFTVESMDKQ